MSRNNVRGLTVFQPHAAMIVSGFKTLETRDWIPEPDSGVPLGWKGTLLIVSGEQSEKHDAWSMHSFSHPLILGAADRLMRPERRAKQAGQGKSIFSNSCILGAVDLLQVAKVHKVMCPDCPGWKKIRDEISPESNVPADWYGLIVDTGEALMRTWAIDPLEYALGIYEPGRYVWNLANPRRLPTLIPFEGQRRLFEVPEEILQQIEAQGVTL